MMATPNQEAAFLSNAARQFCRARIEILFCIVHRNDHHIPHWTGHDVTCPRA